MCFADDDVQASAEEEDEEAEELENVEDASDDDDDEDEVEEKEGSDESETDEQNGEEEDSLPAVSQGNDVNTDAVEVEDGDSDDDDDDVGLECLYQNDLVSVTVEDLDLFYAGFKFEYADILTG